MTNSQAAARGSWLVRCSPHISESSRSNSHDINHGRYSILLPWCLPGCQAFAPATYTPILIPAAPTTSFTSPLETSPGCTWYITPSDNNKFSQSLPFSLQVQSPQATFTDQIFYFLLQIQIAKSCSSHFKSPHHYYQLLYDLRRLFLLISAAMQDPLEHILLHRCVDQHQKQKDEMLEPPCIPYPWIQPGTSHLQLHYSRTFPTLPPNHPLASPNLTPHYPPTSSSLPPHYPPSFPTLPPQYPLTFLAYYPPTFPTSPIHYPPNFSSSPPFQRVIGHSKTHVTNRENTCN